MITRAVDMEMTTVSPQFVKTWQSVRHSLYMCVNVWDFIWRLSPQRTFPVIVRLEHIHMVYFILCSFPALKSNPSQGVTDEYNHTVTCKILSLQLPLTFNFQFWLMHLQNSKTFCWALILKCPPQSCWCCTLRPHGMLAAHQPSSGKI